MRNLLRQRGENEEYTAWESYLGKARSILMRGATRKCNLTKEQIIKRGKTGILLTYDSGRTWFEAWSKRTSGNILIIRHVRIVEIVRMRSRHVTSVETFVKGYIACESTL